MGKFLIVTTVVFVMAAGVFGAGYGGGSGTAEDPFQIWTGEEMNFIGADPNNWDKCFALMDDVDLSGVEFNIIGYTWLPFSGSFNGDGHLISGLSLVGPQQPTEVGMFGFISGADIKGLSFVSPIVRRFYGESGVLAGRVFDSTISNCFVEGGEVRGDIFAGGLVGYARNTSFDGCYVAGCEVNKGAGAQAAGGLVGKLLGEIDQVVHVSNCYSVCVVEGGNAGGLIGESENAVFRECYSRGAVTGVFAGGLIGMGRGLEVYECWSDADVIGESNAGGLVGSNWGYFNEPRNGRIGYCFAAGDVRGDRAGGLAGTNSGEIFDSYSIGDVVGAGNYAGGFVGATWSLGEIKNCYSVGMVSAEVGSQFGGFVGNISEGNAESNYWDVEMSEQDESWGAEGKTNAEMMSGLTYEGWDGTVWTVDEGDDYPRLWWEGKVGRPIWVRDCYGGGYGTADNPYLLSEPNHLVALSRNEGDWGRHFEVTADIDMSEGGGSEFRPIGYYYWGHPWNRPAKGFTGFFNGCAYTISGFTWHYSGDVASGFFSYVSGDGVVKNVVLREVNVEAVETRCVGSLVGYLEQGEVRGCRIYDGYVSGEMMVGGLVGRNIGLVARSGFEGEVVGNYEVGGLIGCNDEPGNYDNIPGDYGDVYSVTEECFALGTVRGKDQVGGLAGVGGFGKYGISVMRNCYSSCNVSGQQSYVGGFVGSIGGRAYNCYASGKVEGDGNVGGFAGSGWAYGHLTENCFWDVLTTGSSSMCGFDWSGECDDSFGKTTEEMQILSTFVDAGWDFVGEDLNGVEDVWVICDGLNYPRFVWQVGAFDFVCPDGVGVEDLVYFAERWLGDGDEGFDFVDFGVMAEGWLEE